MKLRRDVPGFDTEVNELIQSEMPISDNVAKTSRPLSLGSTSISYTETSGPILTKATGFMDAYDYTLNPYSGCSFRMYLLLRRILQSRPRQTRFVGTMGGSQRETRSKKLRKHEAFH